jgi:hypothetical protein
MERYVLDDIKIIVPFEEIAGQLKLAEEDDREEFRELFNKAMAVARPKAVYRVCYLDGIEGDAVAAEGAVFRSQVMAGNLNGLHRVFAYVLSCGTEVDEFAKQQDDYIVRIWMDMLKEMILRKARVVFFEHIKQTYGFPVLSSMSPGSGNIDTWPISQQADLFRLIGNVREDIGVTLNDSMLMDPNKSVSGILFQSDKEYVGCTLCRREKCQGRKAEYNPSLPGALPPGTLPPNTAHP